MGLMLLKQSVISPKNDTDLLAHCVVAEIILDLHFLLFLFCRKNTRNGTTCLGISSFGPLNQLNKTN